VPACCCWWWRLPYPVGGGAGGPLLYVLAYSTRAAVTAAGGTGPGFVLYWWARVFPRDDFLSVLVKLCFVKVLESCKGFFIGF